jgi:hypothetical protein
VNRVAVLTSVTFLLACDKGGTASPPKGEERAARQVPVAGTVAGSCPRTGHWGECQIRARLDEAGMAPHITTESIGGLPKLGVTPIELTLGRATLAFYVFPDSLSRRKAAASLDTLTFIPQSKPLTMRNESTVIVNDNALAILLSRNEHQRERVNDVITAGPPQP